MRLAERDDVRNSYWVASHESMQNPFSNDPHLVRRSTLLAARGAEASAEEHGQGVHLLLVRFLRWGTRNNGCGIGRKTGDA